MFFIITAILFVVGLTWAICRYCFKDKVHHKLFKFLLDEKTTDYAVTLIFTVVGVTLAILFANIDTDNKDRTKAVKLLAALQTECNTVELDAKLYQQLISQQQQDGKNDGQILSWYYSEPLKPVTSFAYFLSNDLVIAQIHTYTYYRLIDSYRASIDSFNQIVPPISLDDLKFELTLISQNMEFCQELINLEINNQKLKDQSFVNEVNNLDNKLFTDEVN